MRFSIVTVCYNSEKVISRAMASLERQSFRDYEWIVIDGKSTDRTVQIVSTFSGSSLRLVSEPDSGIYDAMNKGVGLAKGEYLFFLNSDDALHDDDVLQDVDKFLGANEEVDFLFGKIVNVRADGNWLRTYRFVNKHNIVGEGICHQAIFARRGLFETVGRFNPEFRINADYDWIIRVFLSGATCRPFERTVAFFTDGGAHSLDRVRLAMEREAVRRQYVSSFSLSLLVFRARLMNKLHKLVFGRPRGFNVAGRT